MLEWLIVGGGIHGTYLANLLTQQPHSYPSRSASSTPTTGCWPPGTA